MSQYPHDEKRPESDDKNPENPEDWDDSAWDAFLPDDEEPLPDRGDFWIEPEAA